MTDNNTQITENIEVTEQSEQLQKFTSFDALNLKPSLLRGIYGKGFS